jgi:hypothetical protein
MLMGTPTGTARQVYLAAALVGLVQALVLFPVDFLLPSSGQPWRPMADAAQHALAQRYFVAEPWGWPLLEVRALAGGVNLAFLDGIPALALPLKFLAPVLPEGFHAIGLYYLLAWVLQPVAAVWALRGAGVRSFWPCLCVAVMASAMPAFIMRFGHAALTGHFVVLTALGFYLRLLTAPRLWALAVPFQLFALLIHPYLALMSIALLAAVPLTLALRRASGVLAALAGSATAAGVMLGTLALLGYIGAEGDGGYGRYALNLLSPAWPHRSWFLGGFVRSELSATGEGGWDSFNWLGLGLWLLLGAAALLAPSRLLGLPLRHVGLALALAGLTLLAITFQVGVGGRIILDLGPPPAFLEQFRGSGRFFWPVAYALLIGGAAVVARRVPVGVPILAVAALVQWLDARPMRAALAQWAGERAPWTLDAPGLRPLLAKAERVTILPTWDCVPWDVRFGLLEPMFLASETPRPVNTVYVARWRTPPICRDAETAASPLSPGELRLIMPIGAPLPEPAGRCVSMGAVRACHAGF